MKKTLTTATLAAALALAACSSHDAPPDAANDTLILNDEGAGAEGNFALENGGVFAANTADTLDANVTDAANATEIPGNAP